jgi:hypothetical protein
LINTALESSFKVVELQGQISVTLAFIQKSDTSGLPFTFFFINFAADLLGIVDIPINFWIYNEWRNL